MLQTAQTKNEFVVPTAEGIPSLSGSTLLSLTLLILRLSF